MQILFFLIFFLYIVYTNAIYDERRRALIRKKDIFNINYVALKKNIMDDYHTNCNTLKDKSCDNYLINLITFNTTLTMNRIKLSDNNHILNKNEINEIIMKFKCIQIYTNVNKWTEEDQCYQIQEEYLANKIVLQKSIFFQIMIIFTSFIGYFIISFFF